VGLRLVRQVPAQHREASVGVGKVSVAPLLTVLSASPPGNDSG